MPTGVSMTKLCAVCGKEISARNKMYCSHTCAGLSRQNYKICPICGTKFPSPPSSNTKTCGKEACVIQQRLNASYAPEVIESIGKGRISFQATPEGSKGYDFHGAKNWIIVSPDGKIHECRNLMHWLREHADMIDGTVMQAWDGITKIKYSMQGKRKNPGHQWKGWRLLSWGEKEKREDK